jgi:hypothetical protein
MPASWKLYRVVCILQVMISSFILFTSLIDIFRITLFSNVAGIILFLLVISLAVLAVNILNNNYPDTPITGKQKKTFNWLFLLNFIFLAVLFGFIISETRSLRHFANLLDKKLFELPIHFFIKLIAYLVVLIFQLVILYGLYILRFRLYDNFIKQKFEFEK